MRLDTVRVPEVLPADPPEVMVAPLLRVTTPAVPVPPSVPLSLMVPAVPLTVRVVPEAAVIALFAKLAPLFTMKLPTFSAVPPLKLLVPLVRVTAPDPFLVNVPLPEMGPSDRFAAL